MKKSKKVHLVNINNFSEIIKSLTSFIEKYWECDIKPKGYDKFLEDYEDYYGMTELDEKSLENEFNGFKDGTAISFSFPIKISLPHVAYDDMSQGRNPLTTLISACVSHGMLIEQKRSKIKNYE